MIRIFMLTWPWDSAARVRPARAMPPLLPDKQLSVESYNSVDIAVPNEPQLPDGDSKPDKSFEDEEEVKQTTAEVNVGKLDSAFLETFSSKQTDVPLTRGNAPRRKVSKKFANNLAFLGDDANTEAKEVNVGKLDPSYIEMFGTKGTDDTPAKGHRRKQSMGSGKLFASTQSFDDGRSSQPSSEKDAATRGPGLESDNREGAARASTVDGASIKSITLAENNSPIEQQHSSSGADVSDSKEENPLDAKSATDIAAESNINKLDPSLTEAFLKGQDQSSSRGIDVNKLDQSMIDPFKHKENEKAGPSVNVNKLPSSMMTPFLQQQNVDSGLSRNTGRRRSSKASSSSNPKKEQISPNSKSSDGSPSKQIPVRDISLVESGTGKQPNEAKTTPHGRTKVVEEPMSSEKYSMKSAPNTTFHSGLHDELDDRDRNGHKQRKIIEEPMTAMLYTKKAAANIPSHFRDTDDSFPAKDIFQSQSEGKSLGQTDDGTRSKSEKENEKIQPPEKHLSSRAQGPVDSPIRPATEVSSECFTLQSDQKSTPGNDSMNAKRSTDASKRLMSTNMEGTKQFIDQNKDSSGKETLVENDQAESLQIELVSSGFESVNEQDIRKCVSTEKPNQNTDKYDANSATTEQLTGKLGAACFDPINNEAYSVSVQQQQIKSGKSIEDKQGGLKHELTDSVMDYGDYDAKLANSESKVGKLDAAYIDPFNNKIKHTSGTVDGGNVPRRKLSTFDGGNEEVGPKEINVGKLDPTFLELFGSKQKDESSTKRSSKVTDRRTPTNVSSQSSPDRDDMSNSTLTSTKISESTVLPGKQGPNMLNLVESYTDSEQSSLNKTKEGFLGLKTEDKTTDSSNKLKDFIREPTNSNMNDQLRCGLSQPGFDIPSKSIPENDSTRDVKERPVERDLSIGPRIDNGQKEADNQLQDFIVDQTKSNLPSDKFSLKSTPQKGNEKFPQSDLRQGTLSPGKQIVDMAGNQRDFISRPIDTIRDITFAPTLSNMHEEDSNKIIASDTVSLKSAPLLDSKEQSAKTGSIALEHEDQCKITNVDNKTFCEPTISIQHEEKVFLESEPEADAKRVKKEHLLDSDPMNKAPEPEDKSMTSRLRDFIFGPPSLKQQAKRSKDETSMHPTSKEMPVDEATLGETNSTDSSSKHMTPAAQSALQEAQPKDHSDIITPTQPTLLRSSKLNISGENANDHMAKPSSTDSRGRLLPSEGQENTLEETFEIPTHFENVSTEHQMLRMQHKEEIPKDNDEMQSPFIDTRNRMLAPEKLENILQQRFDKPTGFESVQSVQDKIQLRPQVKAISDDNDENQQSVIDTKERILPSEEDIKTTLQHSPERPATFSSGSTSANNMMLKSDQPVSEVKTIELQEDPDYEDGSSQRGRTSTDFDTEFPYSKKVVPNTTNAQEKLVTFETGSINLNPIRCVRKTDIQTNTSSDISGRSMKPDALSTDENQTCSVHQGHSAELAENQLFSGEEGNRSLQFVRGPGENIDTSQTLELMSPLDIQGHNNESADTLQLEQDESTPEALSEDESSVTKNRQISEKEENEKLKRTKSVPNQSKKVKSAQHTHLKPFTFSSSRSSRKNTDKPIETSKVTLSRAERKGSSTPNTSQVTKQWKKSTNAQQVVSAFKSAPKTEVKLRTKSVETSSNQIKKATSKTTEAKPFSFQSRVRKVEKQDDSKQQRQTTEAKPFSFQTRVRKVVNKDDSKQSPESSMKKLVNQSIERKLKQPKTDLPGNSKIKSLPDSASKRSGQSRDGHQKKAENNARNLKSPKAKTDEQEKSKERRKPLHRRASSNTDRYDSGDTDDTSLSDDDVHKQGSKPSHKRMKSLRSVLKLTDPTSFIHEAESDGNDVTRSLQKQKKHRVRFVDQGHESVDSEHESSDFDNELGRMSGNDIQNSNHNSKSLDETASNSLYRDQPHSTKVWMSQKHSPLKGTEGGPLYTNPNEDASIIDKQRLQSDETEQIINVRPAEGVTSFASSEETTHARNQGDDSNVKPINPLNQVTSKRMMSSSKNGRPGLHVDLPGSERTEKIIEEALLRSDQPTNDSTLTMDSPDTTFTIRPTFPNHSRQPSYPYAEDDSSNEAASGLSYITIGNSQLEAHEEVQSLTLDNLEVGESEDCFAAEEADEKLTEDNDDKETDVDQHLVPGDVTALKEDINTELKVELPEELAPKALKGSKVDRNERILPRLKRAELNHRREWYLPYREAEDGHLETKPGKTATLSKKEPSGHQTDSETLTTGSGLRRPHKNTDDGKKPSSVSPKKRGYSAESSSMIKRDNASHPVASTSEGGGLSMSSEALTTGSDIKRPLASLVCGKEEYFISTDRDDDSTPVGTEGGENPSGGDKSREEYCIPLAEREKQRIKRLWSIGYKGSRGRSTKPTLASVVNELERQRKLNHVDIDDKPPEPSEPIIIPGKSVSDLVRGFETIKQTKQTRGKPSN